MNLYVADWAWQGAVSVVAESREEASKLAEVENYFVKPEDWIEYDFKTVARTYGDQ